MFMMEIVQTHARWLFTSCVIEDAYVLQLQYKIILIQTNISSVRPLGIHELCNPCLWHMVQYVTLQLLIMLTP